VVFWDVATSKPSGEALRASVGDGNPGLYPGSVSEIAFSADGRWLLAAVGAGGQGEVVAWSWPSPSVEHRFRADTRQAYAVTVAPDSRTVASIGQDGKVRFFDLVAGKPLSGFLEGHGGPATSAAFSPDGTILATAGSDGSPILWDVGTHKQVGAPLPGPSQGTRMHVGFMPDGRHLLGQYFDGQTWAWDVDPSSWRDRACSIAGRNLTKDEWDKLLLNRHYRRTCEQWPPGT
jgi:WD40 repeat protein